MKSQENEIVIVMTVFMSIIIFLASSQFHTKKSRHLFKGI